MNEQLKEEIRFYTELIKLLTVIVLANLTGLISLFRLDNPRPGEQLLGLLGIFVTIFSLLLILALNYKVFVNIKRIKT
jgi:hypothetical protein